MRTKRYFGACVVAIVCAGAAHGQFLNDGDMEALAVGTAPDCALANGAWGFPANYITNALCEDGTTVSYDVATTTTKVLRLKATSATLNTHLPNLFTSVINETPGQIVDVQFDIRANATNGAGSVYVGADHGGGGFSNATDRGPQLLFLATGDLAYTQLVAGTPVNTNIATYPKDTWMTVLLQIDLASDTFDISMAPTGNPLVLVGDNLTYRSGMLNKLDRFSWAFFAATTPLADAEVDNVSVTIEASNCYPDCDGDSALSIDDFICFQTFFALGDLYADCDESGDLSIDDFICFQTFFAIGC